MFTDSFKAMVKTAMVGITNYAQSSYIYKLAELYKLDLNAQARICHMCRKQTVKNPTMFTKFSQELFVTY